MSKNFKSWIHPISLGIFPVISLYAHNISETDISSGFRALGVCFLGAVLLLLIFMLIKKNWQKAGLLTSLSLILFFSYGHVYNTLEGLSIFGFVIGRHIVLTSVWVVVLIAGYIWVTRLQTTKPLINALNIFAVSALLLPIFQIISFEINTLTLETSQLETSEFVFHLPKDQPPPDIYYIILDGYARDDSLLEDYGVDNTAFLNMLEEAGFYVAFCSRSNYSQTKFSLVTSLNMKYLEELVPPKKIEESRSGDFGKLIRNNAFRQIMEELGYKTVGFETGFGMTQFKDADIYLSPNQTLFGTQDLSKQLNEFEILFIKSTATLLLIEGSQFIPQFSPIKIVNTWEIHRQRVLFTLDQLEKIPTVEGPKFVFAHVVSPHKPFVFNAEGGVSEEPDGKTAYAEQVLYISSRMETIVKILISESATPPIIILQGDHGGAFAEKSSRLEILNAYYLPNNDYDDLYPAITPVNTFRVILNNFYGGDFRLLEDTSLFSLYQERHIFKSFPETRPGCVSP